jgi:hypothetical protein
MRIDNTVIGLSAPSSAPRSLAAARLPSLAPRSSCPFRQLQVNQCGLGTLAGAGAGACDPLDGSASMCAGRFLARRAVFAPAALIRHRFDELLADPLGPAAITIAQKEKGGKSEGDLDEGGSGNEEREAP